MPAFNPNTKFPKAHIDTKKMQYLYTDGEFYHFMDEKICPEHPKLTNPCYDFVPFNEVEKEFIELFNMLR